MSNYFFIAFFFLFVCHSQQSETTNGSQTVTGRIVETETNFPIENVVVRIEKLGKETKTNQQGDFVLKVADSVIGNYLVTIYKPGYQIKNYPVVFSNNRAINLLTISLVAEANRDLYTGAVINLTDEDLDNEANDISYFNAGILQASKDVFTKAAAYDFSSSFFRPRGLDAAYHSLQFNGVEMTKAYTNRPQWSSWGGINDMLRNQNYQYGISTNEANFGNLAGSTIFNLNSSNLREGGRISFASANRTYRNRIMGTYVSGISEKGWSYALTLSRRFAQQGYVEGTPYDANSFFTSVDKQWNKKHSLSLIAWYTPNQRGRSSALTQEVFNLRGNRYNPNWGYYYDEIKNSKTRRIEEPTGFLTYTFKPSNRFQAMTTVAYRYGIQTNSRLDNTGINLKKIEDQNLYSGGGRSVHINPVHQANLPSYYQPGDETLLLNNYAYDALTDFQKDGQIDWKSLIDANQIQAKNDNNAIYTLYNDQTEDRQFDLSSSFEYKVKKNLQLQGGISFAKVQSENFAKVEDLLGGTQFLDVNVFALDDKNSSGQDLQKNAQSDLQNENRLVEENDIFKYHYVLDARRMNAFFKTEWRIKKMAVSLSAALDEVSYQREGLFENGYFPGDQSFGKSEKITFLNPAVKAGLTYQINGRHSLQASAGYLYQSPTAQQSFSNIRKNNNFLANLDSEINTAIETSYFWQTPKLKVRLTGYHIEIDNAIENNFYFTQTLAIKNLSETAAFVQESLTGADKKHWGAELGISYQIIPTLTLKSVAAFGEYRYTSNPDLIIDIDQGTYNISKSYLNNYRIAKGPQEAYQFGFDYRDPKFWWLGITANYFRSSYVAPSALKRTGNFNKDPESNTVFNDYDASIAKALLQQERLPDYYTINMVGGKSWRLGSYYVGFFVTVSNLLNTTYQSGGYEQSRLANYRTQQQESQRETPVFGNKYFYGFGSTYFANLYLRF